MTKKGREKKEEIDEGKKKEEAIAREKRKPALCCSRLPRYRRRTRRKRAEMKPALVRDAREIGVSPSMKNEIYKLPRFYAVISLDASLREKYRKLRARDDF